MEDKVTITITLERELNGTVKRTQSIMGEGFHLFELVGLLQISCYDLANKSTETAKELPEDGNVRIKFSGK